MLISRRRPTARRETEEKRRKGGEGKKEKERARFLPLGLIWCNCLIGGS